jgi:hypothetical protein
MNDEARRKLLAVMASVEQDMVDIAGALQRSCSSEEWHVYQQNISELTLDIERCRSYLLRAKR